MNKLLHREPPHCMECGRLVSEPDHPCPYCGTNFPTGVQCCICQAKLPKSHAVSVLINPDGAMADCHEFCLTANPDLVALVVSGERRTRGDRQNPLLSAINPDPINHIATQQKPERSRPNALAENARGGEPTGYPQPDVQVQVINRVFDDPAQPETESADQSGSESSFFVNPLHNQPWSTTQAQKVKPYGKMMEQLLLGFKQLPNGKQSRQESSQGVAFLSGLFVWC